MVWYTYTAKAPDAIWPVVQDSLIHKVRLSYAFKVRMNVIHDQICIYYACSPCFVLLTSVNHATINPHGNEWVYRFME